MQKLFSLSLILVVSPVTGREGRSTKVPGKPLGVPKEAGPFHLFKPMRHELLPEEIQAQVDRYWDEYRSNQASGAGK